MILLLLLSSAKIIGMGHCGYDVTSLLVLYVYLILKLICLLVCDWVNVQHSNAHIEVRGQLMMSQFFTSIMKMWILGIELRLGNKFLYTALLASFKVLISSYKELLWLDPFLLL